MPGLSGVIRLEEMTDMSMFFTRSVHGDVQQEMIRRRSASLGGLPRPCRAAGLVGVALAGLLASGASVAGPAVPVSIEGGEFRLGTEVNTTVTSDSPEKRVEVGTTAEGVPVTVTRLSYRKVSLGGDEAHGEEASMTQGHDESSDDTVTMAEGGDEVVGTGSTEMSTKALPDEEETVPFLMHAVTPRSVSIAWEGDASAVYNIYRDGQLLAQVSGAQYVDETVSPGTEYQYSIEAITAPADLSEGPSVSGAIHVRTLDESTGATSVSSPKATKAVRTGGPTATLYKRRAFIADEWVNVGSLEAMGCGVWNTREQTRFKGDNRGFSEDFHLDPNKSRTEISLTVDWTRSPITLTRKIHVSETLRLVNDKEYTKTAKPNRGWFVSGRRNSNGTYARMVLHHNIGNPFCAVGSIRYGETVHMWNNGTVMVAGWRRPVPHHEAIAGLEFAGGRGFRSFPLFQRDNHGFHCLIRWACAEDRYRGPDR